MKFPLKIKLLRRMVLTRIGAARLLPNDFMSIVSGNYTVDIQIRESQKYCAVCMNGGIYGMPYENFMTWRGRAWEVIEEKKKELVLADNTVLPFEEI
jgi:hypothetical protein